MKLCKVHQIDISNSEYVCIGVTVSRIFICLKKDNAYKVSNNVPDDCINVKVTFLHQLKETVR